MIEVSDIKNLSKDDKHKLINYIEGMPSDINKYVKISLNEPFMNPSLFKGSERKIHEFSSIRKYLNKNDVSNIDNPMGSYYQSEYSKVQFLINNSKYPNSLKSKLSVFMDADCYDDESIMKMELYISNLLEEYEKYDFVTDLACFINEEILTYKLKVYDFYTYLSIKDELNIINGNYDHLFTLNCIINSIIENGSSFYDTSNLAVFIYCYFKEIGIEEHIEKYKLANRFCLALMNYNKDSDFVESMMDKLVSLINEKTCITDAISTLVKSEKINKEFLRSSDSIIDSNSDETYKSIECNGYVYLSENPEEFREDINMITNQIKILTSDRIIEYLDDSTIEKYIDFSLNDNDYGHLHSVDNIIIGTCYDSFNGEIKYIGKYDGNYYVFFKIRIKPNSIFGISLDNNMSNKKILEIKESKAYYYKYVSNF